LDAGNDERRVVLRRPASKKRQGTKSREVSRRLCRERYGDLIFAPAVELKAAHLVGRRRIGQTLEPGGKPLAALDVAALRVRIELARSHVFDHTLTQRTDGVGLAHEELHPE